MVNLAHYDIVFDRISYVLDKVITDTSCIFIVLCCFVFSCCFFGAFLCLFLR